MTMFVGIGVMSGTSVDGIDLCCVEFIGDEEADNWKYTVLCAETVPYSATWRKRLQTAHCCSGQDLAKLHVEYGHLIGEHVHRFMDEHLDIDDIRFVASHGHTVFHQPWNNFTFQLGDGETTAALIECPLVTNFRAKDVALGGQGAPLVHVGERHLFADCNVFLNLGGISNISVSGKAFDIVPCNMLLNYLASKYDPEKQYDLDGDLAREGAVLADVLTKLNSLEYYSQPSPKSLSREWFETELVHHLDTKVHSVRDLLRTAVEHITDQICQALRGYAPDNSAEPVRLENTLLVTGGGALNTFLMETLTRKASMLPTPITFVEVDSDTVKYKEAISFAFLGLRTLLGLRNTLASVTGSRSDAVSGSIHVPPFGNALLPHLNSNCPFHIMRKISKASVGSYGSTEQLGIPEHPGLRPSGLLEETLRPPVREYRTHTQ